jgi:hypothetical protein
MTDAVPPPAEHKWHPRELIVGADGLVRPVWRCVAFLVLAIFLVIVLQTALRVVAPDLPERWGMMVASSVVVAAWLLLSWGVLAALDRRSFRTLGLWFYSAWARELLIGIAIGAGMIAVVVGIQVAFGAVRYAGVSPAPDEALRSAGWLAVMLFIAASLEEILFRGYAFQRLVDSLGRVLAVSLFSVLFGGAHLSNPGATWLSTANTVLAGVLLAVAYLKTRALWLPIGLHWGWNYFMTAVFALPVSGFDFGEKFFGVEFAGPEWLSGGKYGPEGSVVLTMVCVATIVALARSPRVKVSEAMSQAIDSSSSRAELR